MEDFLLQNTNKINTQVDQKHLDQFMDILITTPEENYKKMIKKIKDLKQFGIFKNYSNKSTQDFNTLNLIYGLNGSGKTTLVELFESLKNKKVSDRFSSSEFTITTLENQNITQNNLDDMNLNLHIFNNSFIQKHINWNRCVESILLIDETKITEQKNLKQLNNTQKEDNEKKQQKEYEIKKLTESIDKFITKTARNIKNQLQVIDTKDRYFMNYNKTKLEKCIMNKEEQIKKEEFLLPEKIVTQYIEEAKPNKKDLIQFNIFLYNYEKLTNKEKEITALLKRSIVSNTIKKLTSNTDIQLWVEKGLKIHKTHQSSNCEFCENVLSKNRIKKLEEHFNKDFESLKSILQNTLNSFDKLYIKIDTQLPKSEKFYPEYQEQFKEYAKNLKEIITNINNYLKEWENTLKNKINNPYNTVLTINNLNNTLINDYNSCLQSIMNLVEKHNQKTNNFQEETNAKKQDLEKHYITREFIDFQYYLKQEKVNKQQKELQLLETQIENRKQKIEKLEHSLSNEGIGAKKINSQLHSFLGRNNLSLKFNEEKKGYEIIRDQESQHSQNLSEGEKRAISFVYFITKLKEKSNKIKDSIVIIDDPISSFDSNNLFSAYSFLKANCEQVKQLFVFTHNFSYFKLVRDWFNKKNKNRKNEKKGIKAHFFTINIQIFNNQRNAELQKAPSCLIKYHSEYHYIFSQLYKYKDYKELKINEAFLTANLARRLLESFFYFKYPKHRSDLNALLDSGIKTCENTTKQTKEKIYNFINKYSHSDKIETNEDTAQNLLGESTPVITDIFKWIKEVDKTHYDEMITAIKD